MTKVYVLIYNDGEENVFCAAYERKEKAKLIAQLLNSDQEDCHEYHILERDLL